MWFNLYDYWKFCVIVYSISCDYNLLLKSVTSDNAQHNSQKAYFKKNFLGEHAPRPPNDT